MKLIKNGSEMSMNMLRKKLLCDSLAAGSCSRHPPGSLLRRPLDRGLGVRLHDDLFLVAEVLHPLRRGALLQGGGYDLPPVRARVPIVPHDVLKYAGRGVSGHFQNDWDLPYESLTFWNDF